MKYEVVKIYKLKVESQKAIPVVWKEINVPPANDNLYGVFVPKAVKKIQKQEGNGRSNN